MKTVHCLLVLGVVALVAVVAGSSPVQAPGWDSVTSPFFPYPESPGTPVPECTSPAESPLPLAGTPRAITAITLPQTPNPVLPLQSGNSLKLLSGSSGTDIPAGERDPGTLDPVSRSATLSDALDAYPLAHTRITSFNGSSTCIGCHRQQAVAMFGAVHYQWTGPTPNVPNIPGYAGKAVKGFNTYCGSVESSRHIACYSCHAGAGLNPNRTLSTAQLNNIDCMMCHQAQYRRSPAPPFVNLTFQDYTGKNHTWRLPAEDSQGNFKYVINQAQMPITAVQAAQTVHLPTRENCLQCHAYAAGSNCGKRGDISAEMVNPPRSADVHMSPQGANLSCQDCHQFTNHHVLGRGLDIRENDVPGTLTCTSGGCHTATPHTANQSFWLNRHTTAVACQSCHIPRYAKLNTTEMSRDWTGAFWFPPMFSNQGGYKPEEIRRGNVTPVYGWYNGTSYVYIRGQVPPRRADGMYLFSMPYGNVFTAGTSKIVPMKVHTSNAAMQNSTRRVIPWSTFTFFVTGDFNRSVRAGQVKFNMTGPWSFVNVLAYQTINHQVEPAGKALQCRACHKAFSGGAPTRLNLTTLGYRLKGPESQVCIQCHGQEQNPGFLKVHNTHRQEGVACSSCHIFPR